AVIESVLTFSITVWYGSITAKKKLRLNKARRIIGKQLPSLDFQQRLLRRVVISHDPFHPAYVLFKRLPSGRRFRSVRTKTKTDFSRVFIRRLCRPCQISWDLVTFKAATAKHGQGLADGEPRHLRPNRIPQNKSVCMFGTSADS
ncbi:hypothetical protein BaRGS_00013374, partial [Batillaria attramentaria]